LNGLDLCLILKPLGNKMSSGSYKKHHGFNPVQIKNGMIVRLRKDGTIKAVLGKYGEYKKNVK
jgi:hypothetical protein